MSDQKVALLPSANLQDIPRMLRELAKQIERGDYGSVTEASVVIAGDAVEVFGFGRADAPATHYLLGCGMAMLQRGRIGA